MQNSTWFMDKHLSDNKFKAAYSLQGKQIQNNFSKTGEYLNILYSALWLVPCHLNKLTFE